MNIAQISVSRPVAVTMRIAALVLLGAICFTKLSVDLLPKVSIPTVVVITQWPNVAPEELESQVTRPIEEAVAQAPNIFQVSSSTTQGSSVVRVQFNWGTNIGQSAVDVLQLAQRAKRNFPNDPTLQDPLVFKFDPSTLPILVYGVSSDSMDMIKLRTMMDNEVSPIIESADGVAAALVTGGQTRSIIINADPVKLKAFGITTDDVVKRIEQENTNVPGGIGKQGNTESSIRAVGFFNSPQEAAKVPLGNYNGHLVYLGDVANVSDSSQETRIYTRLNGTPAVGLVITKQSDANTVTTARSVVAKIGQVEKMYPQLKFGEAYDQAGFIENSIDDLKTSAMIGGALAILILLFFLRNFRSTLVVALSIPTSIVSTFALLYFCGFTLNTISLSGLALATGLIVDDAVVVLENIFRHIERDKRRAAEAAVTGAREISSAVVASTFTVMIVFLPLLLIQGQAGQMFTQFALVVIFSIAVSLLDATTVVPMLSSRIIKEHEVIEEAQPELREELGIKPTPVSRIFDWCGRKFNALDRSYHNGLNWAIHHRWQVILGAIGITALVYPLVGMIGSEMLPQTDSGDFTVAVKLPVNAALSSTNEVMKQVEKRLLANPDVMTVFSAAGATIRSGNTSAPIQYQGSATVRLKPDRKHSTQDDIKLFQRQLGQIPGARVLVTPYDLVTNIIAGGNTNMEVDVFGQNLQSVYPTARQVMGVMQGIKGLESVDLGVQDASPELQIRIDRQKAQQLGISFQDVANTVATATNGQQAGYYQENGLNYPIYVQVPEGNRKTIDEILNLPISSPNSKSKVLLGQVASITQGTGPNEITRLNRQRYISVQGRVSGRSEGEVQADVQKALASVQMPQGVYWDFGSSQKQRSQEFSGLGLAVFLAIALIYMLLATQFESFIYPLIVLSSVPLCAVGVILALFLSGRAFGLTSFIGLLMLIGIVVKNGILLVDYTNQLRGRGLERDEALLTAGPTRLRPILMTSGAAILGMMPLAIGMGRGSETEAPLATAVIGGLTTSTILTLFVVPVVYTFFDDLARRLRRTRLDLAPSHLVGPSVSAVEKLVEPDSPMTAPEGSEIQHE